MLDATMRDHQRLPPCPRFSTDSSLASVDVVYDEVGDRRPVVR
jgi:hypothetical protein